MSSVLARKRKISEMEFYRLSYELRSKLTLALMNDNIVPKRYRPIFTFPTLEIARHLIDHIIVAFNVYPNKQQFVDDRRAMQKAAIDDLDMIDDQLQYLVDTLFKGRVDADRPLPGAIEECGELIDKIRPLLVAWRKSTKLIN